MKGQVSKLYKFLALKLTLNFLNYENFENQLSAACLLACNEYLQ